MDVWPPASCREQGALSLDRLYYYIEILRFVKYFPLILKYFPGKVKRAPFQVPFVPRQKNREARGGGWGALRPGRSDPDKMSCRNEFPSGEPLVEIRVVDPQLLHRFFQQAHIGQVDPVDNVVAVDVIVPA